MKGRCVALIGMPGSGKSTVGKILARQLGVPIVDTDALIEKKTGESIPEIFGKHGEAHFRKLETEALRAASENPCVISCGGGIVTSPDSRLALGENCTVVYLAATVDELCARVGDGSGRPLLSRSPRENLGKLYESRRGLYEECADLTADTCGKSPQGIAAEIAEKLSDYE